jgi:hypothetical protein
MTANLFDRKGDAVFVTQTFGNARGSSTGSDGMSGYIFGLVGQSFRSRHNRLLPLLRRPDFRKGVDRATQY